MASATTRNVHTGQWLDKNRALINQWQYLTTSLWSQVWTNTLSIWMSVVLASTGFIAIVFVSRLFIRLLGPVVTKLFAPITRAYRRRWPAPAPISLNYPDRSTMMTTFINAADLRDARHRFYNDNLLRRTVPSSNMAAPPTTYGTYRALKELRDHAQEDPAHFAGAILVFVLLGAYFLGFSALIAYTSVIASGSTGLSASKACNIYKVPENVDPRLYGRNFELEAEERARLYGRTCYGQPTGIDGCNLYFNQSIYFTEQAVACPFQGNVCEGDDLPAVKYVSGFLETSHLGINIAKPHHVRRQTVCAPVSNDERYVRVRREAGGLQVAEYYYGNLMPNADSWNGIDSEFTWNSSVMSSRDTPSYRLVSLRSDSAGPAAYVLPEFRVENHTITVILIEAGQVFYLHERDDPIFPAQTLAEEDPTGRRLWYNGAAHGSVLMCADTWDICTHDKSRCWNRVDAPPPFKSDGTSPSDVDLAYALLWHGLLASNTYSSIRQSQSYGLDAQRHINQQLVTGLADEQWKVEARLLFQTSLARLQQDIYDIERGTAKGQEGFEGTLPAHYRDLCGIYKFTTVGYTNVNVALTIIMAIGPVVAWMLFQKWEDEYGFYWTWKSFVYTRNAIADLF